MKAALRKVSSTHSWSCGRLEVSPLPPKLAGTPRVLWDIVFGKQLWQAVLPLFMLQTCPTFQKEAHVWCLRNLPAVAIFPSDYPASDTCACYVVPTASFSTAFASAKRVPLNPGKLHPSGQRQGEFGGFLEPPSPVTARRHHPPQLIRAFSLSSPKSSCHSFSQR